MADQTTGELNSLGRKDVKRNRKLPFSEWIDKYEVNLSALAEKLDMSRTAVYALKNGQSGAKLSTALAIYYISGGLVDLFSLVKNGEELKYDLREEIKLTHSQARSKIHSKNRQRRYALRRL